MVLAMAASLYKVFNILVNAWPINSETSSCFGPRDPLVGIMEAAQHGWPKAGGNKETAAINNMSIVNGQVILNAPKLPQELR